MVQRKVPNKLGIQADHVKSNKQLVNLKKPSSPPHQEAKKMKKSRSIKRSDLESLRSSRKEIAKTPTKSTESSPNYMKSTSSFDARKECSPPVSSRTSQSSLVSKTTPSPKITEKSKHGSSSGHKASRTSSLKLVRTLTKTPSFKPSRASKKCSSVVLCEDLDVQRATCSSTLKDSKFPNYLELSPGGSELEGTSVMKVCPYTYCSLNGHHHAPLPPLKCFLSARRRVLKNQKSIKLGCLSPRRTKPSGNDRKDIDRGLGIFSEEPEIQEDRPDFFIEIYGKDKEDDKDMASVKADEELMESISDKSPGPEIIFDAVSIVMDIPEFFSGDWIEEVAETTILLNGDDSEASDMEWEMEQFSSSFLEDVPVLKSSQEINDCITQEQIFKPDDTAKRISEETPYEEGSVSSEAWLEDGDSESDGSYQDMEGNQQSYTPHDFPEHDQDEAEKDYTASHDSIQVYISDAVTENQPINEVLDPSLPLITMEQVDVGKSGVRIELSDLSEEFSEADQKTTNEGSDEIKLTAVAEASEMNQIFAEGLIAETQDDSFEKQSDVAKNQDNPEKTSNLSNSKHSADLENSGMVRLRVTETSEKHAVNCIEGECVSESDGEKTYSTAEITSSADTKDLLHVSGAANEELLNPSSKCLRRTRSKRVSQELENSREFNPRGPNFLQLEPDPDAERVDLRHQMMDERKNAEEWMVDFALRQAVTRLAPARKRKVALLVEAFEKVIPIPKYETHLGRTSEVFAHARPMQACS